MTIAVLVPDKLYTVDEVANMLRVKIETVRVWIREGRLRGFMAGGRRAGWRIRETDLEAFMANREGGRDEPPD